mgnify:CR=1 FL=1
MKDIYLRKITVYSIIEMLFFIPLIYWCFLYYVGTQNNEYIINEILNIALITFNIILLIIIGIRKHILKRRRYRYLLSIDDHIM